MSEKMKITPHQITVRDLTAGFEEDFETGSVVAYGGKLDVRPPYQREFVYNDKDRNAVIETVLKGYPLNVMYWAVRSDGTYEVMDGQQRTISICRYVDGQFSIDDKGTYFHHLKEKKDEFLNYQITIYFCEGTEEEKLEWFKIINIAGKPLTEQEMRNAVFTGPWLTDAKKYFSNPKGVAHGKWKNWLSGEVLRQDYLETALDWVSSGAIEDYMGKHQHDSDATELRLYFENVMNWTKTIFPSYRKEMKSVQWGKLYNRYKDGKYSAIELEKEVAALMANDEVQKKSGIYEYVLSDRKIDKMLNPRDFSQSERRTAYERQEGVCPICGKHFEFEEMHGDHIVPWSKGGKTELSNLQMLCTTDNIKKSNGL